MKRQKTIEQDDPILLKSRHIDALLTHLVCPTTVFLERRYTGNGTMNAAERACREHEIMFGSGEDNGPPRTQTTDV